MLLPWCQICKHFLIDTTEIGALLVAKDVISEFLTHFQESQHFNYSSIIVLELFATSPKYYLDLE